MNPPLLPPRPLPRLLVVTAGSLTGGRPLAEVVAAVVAGGGRAVLLREKHLHREERARLAAEIRSLLAPVGGTLLVASDPTIAAEGVHLSATDAFPHGAGGLVGRSCHSSEEVHRAAGEGCDYVTLSPVFLTASKPGYGPPLGPAALAGLSLPVWALGGITAANAASCLAAGASGTAVMGAVMGAGDPAGATAALVLALAGAGS